MDTVVAVATPSGRSGIGILRISGTRSQEIAQAISGVKPPPRVATKAVFRDESGVPIDQGLILFFPAPHSYTGEDVMELQGHGSPSALNALLKHATRVGARLARAGEFTERAFLNGKIDLAQAEAVADLINAGSQRAARAALRVMRGEFSSIVADLHDRLMAIRSQIEAEIDFPEDFVAARDPSLSIHPLDALLEIIDRLEMTARRGSALARGLRIVIVGPPNVGKSTLLNRLLREDRALVSDIAGTTRDVVQGDLVLAGIPVALADTAGLRETKDPIEQLGIERAYAAVKKADIVLFVCDQPAFPERLLQEVEGQLASGAILVKVFNKADLFAGTDLSADTEMLATSALNGAGIDKLEMRLLQSLELTDSAEDEFLARERHLEGLASAHDALRRAKSLASETPIPLDLIAEDLKLGQRALQELVGRVDAEKLLDSIFSQFCIGK